MGCEAQALGSYNVQIQDSIEANSETMLNSSIENAETLSGSLLHSESENSEDEHSALSLALRTWCDQPGASRDHMS